MVWNELKGFWDPVHSCWDDVHYTQFYNTVYDALKAYNPALQVGGPYVTIESTTYTYGPPAGSLSGPWGVVDPRSLQVLEYWLAHKHGADFIAVDARATTTSGGQQADEFTSDQKFAAVDTWIRQRSSLPIWWSEFYDQPPGTSWTPQHQDAALSTAMAEMAVSGAAVALIWSPEADATDPTKRPYLWTYAGVAGGGSRVPSPPASSHSIERSAQSTTEAARPTTSRWWSTPPTGRSTTTERPSARTRSCTSPRTRRRKRVPPPRPVDGRGHCFGGRRLGEDHDGRRRAGARDRHARGTSA